MTVKLVDLAPPSPELQVGLTTWCAQHPGELRMFSRMRVFPQAEMAVFSTMHELINDDLNGALTREHITEGSPRFAWLLGIAVVEARMSPPEAEAELEHPGSTESP